MASPNLLKIHSCTGRTFVLKNDIDSNLKLLELYISKARAAYNAVTRTISLSYHHGISLFHAVSLSLRAISFFPCTFNLTAIFPIHEQFMCHIISSIIIYIHKILILVHIAMFINVKDHPPETLSLHLW